MFLIVAGAGLRLSASISASITPAPNGAGGRAPPIAAATGGSVANVDDLLSQLERHPHRLVHRGELAVRSGSPSPAGTRWSPSSWSRWRCGARSARWRAELRRRPPARAPEARSEIGREQRQVGLRQPVGRAECLVPIGIEQRQLAGFVEALALLRGQLQVVRRRGCRVNCSSLRPPTITDVTPGRPSVQASATWAPETLRALAMSTITSTMS